MARHAAKLTEIDKFWLGVINKYRIVTVDGSGISSAGVEGNDQPPPGRVKRLIELGKLNPNNDGLFDGCPQTYSVSPDA